MPRPLTTPVECWQPAVSGSQRQLDFMVKHGIKAMVGGGAASGGVTDRVMEAWRGAHARAGREIELGTDLTLGYTVHIADTEKKAIEEARAYFEEDMKMFGPLGVGRNLSDEQIAALTDPSKVHSGVLPTLEMAVEGGGWLCGPPGLITEKIMEIQERYPGLEARYSWSNSSGSAKRSCPNSKTRSKYQLQWVIKALREASLTLGAVLSSRS